MYVGYFIICCTITISVHTNNYVLEGDLTVFSNGPTVLILVTDNTYIITVHSLKELP